MINRSTYFTALKRNDLPLNARKGEYLVPLSDHRLQERKHIY